MTLLILLALSVQEPDALIKQLGDEDPEVRQKASAAIERLGMRALPALRAAVKSTDPEVSSRARALISQIERTDLKNQLEEQRKERKKDLSRHELRVHVKPDPDVPFRYVLAAIEAAREAGWEGYRFEYVPEKDIPAAGSLEGDDVKPPPSRIAKLSRDHPEFIVSVTRHGRIRYEGADITQEKLKELLSTRRKKQRYWLVVGGRLVNYHATVRADRAVPWGRVAWVIQTMENTGGVYRLHFSAVMKEDREGVIPTPLTKEPHLQSCPAKRNDSKATQVSIEMKGEHPVWTVRTQQICSRCRKTH